MSLLTIVQRFCERTGLPSPNAVLGSGDSQVLQIKGLLEEVGNDLNRRYSWQATTFEETFTTTATESQGAMTTLAQNGFNYVKNLTLWDRSTILPILGPVDGPRWQQLKAVFVTGPRYVFRILNNQFLVNPIPAAGETWAFEYSSVCWITDSTGATFKEYFTQDTDVCLLDESLLLMGLRAWWKKEKGLEYAEDMRMYEAQAKDAMARDGGKPMLRLDNRGDDPARPGIFVPQGNWMQ